jgi:hypothetical protein
MVWCFLIKQRTLLYGVVLRELQGAISHEHTAVINSCEAGCLHLILQTHTGRLKPQGIHLNFSGEDRKKAVGVT